MPLPLTDIREVAPDTENVVVTEEMSVDGNVSEQELLILCQLVAHFKPTSIFEFGTFDGRTTINLANNAAEDARVYTLDLPADLATSTKYPLTSIGEHSDMAYIQKPEIGSRYKNKPGAEKIMQLLGDSATFDYAPYEKHMDLVFVDGSHAFDYVVNDTEAALLIARPGGTILWHDYGIWPAVTKVLENYYEQDKRFANLKQIAGTTLAFLTM